QLRVSTLGSREHECCHFAPSSSRCSVVQVISRNPGALRTVGRWSFVLDRRTGEAAASRPHAPRPSGFLRESQTQSSRERFVDGTSISTNQSGGSGGSAAARYRVMRD